MMSQNMYNTDEGIKVFPKGRKSIILNKSKSNPRSLGILRNVDAAPVRINSAQFVLQRDTVTIYGYQSNLMNTGYVPLFQTNMEYSAQIAGFSVFDKVAEQIGLMRRGDKEFTYSARIRNVPNIQQVLEQFQTGMVNTDLQALVTALGFSENVEVAAAIPVDTVDWQDFPKTAYVTGYVRDAVTKNVVVDALINYYGPGGNVTDFTDENGYYGPLDLDAGEYDVIVDGGEGYIDWQDKVTLADGENAVDFEIVPI